MLSKNRQNARLYSISISQRGQTAAFAIRALFFRTFVVQATACFVLCKTIRSVPRRGFLFYFVKNVDYVEIQIELDGAVEERRTRPVDR